MKENAETQADQLAREKRAVSYDSYDISVRQIVDMVETGDINISPEYQRHFVWDGERESELIESIFLGIPVPSLYMATNSDNTWEVVDGVQRISTILHFYGQNQGLKVIDKQHPLVLEGLKKLSTFNGVKFADMPRSAQMQFMMRPLRVTTLNDKSDTAVRYDLFERLNTGAVKLHPQEIRNCIFRGPFMDFVREESENVHFRKVVKLSDNESRSAAYEDCALRFFAFRDRYGSFGHQVQEFLNDYVKQENKRGSVRNPGDFEKTMLFLHQELPSGIVRAKRKNITPINLYEAVAVGSCLALNSKKNIRKGILKDVLNDPALTKLTTGGTNSNPMVVGRIEFVRDALI